MTGGIAGVERDLALDQTGAYKAKDGQSGRSVEGVASPDVMDKILDELRSLCHVSESQRPRSCADCFLYSLQATLNGQDYQIVLNDLNLMDSPAGPLVATLGGYLGRVLSP